MSYWRKRHKVQSIGLAIYFMVKGLSITKASYSWGDIAWHIGDLVCALTAGLFIAGMIGHHRLMKRGLTYDTTREESDHGRDVPGRNGETHG